jgi:hypothetical protein
MENYRARKNDGAILHSFAPSANASAAGEFRQGRPAGITKFSRRRSGDDWNDAVPRELPNEQIRKLGLIDYTGSVEIHSPLFNVILRDQPQIRR